MSRSMTELAPLPDRGVIAIAGADRVTFLQGLVSNDVTAAAPGRAVFAALLTPQGRWLADFFILATAEHLLLDAARAAIPALIQKLSRYRLRQAVTLRDASEDYAVYAAWNGAPVTLPADAIAAPDPRHPEAGWRILSTTPLAATASAEAWDAHRLRLGLPEGARDLEAEKTLLLEARYDELNAISWTKGCYMGQELTARTRYRGLVKRRLTPVLIEGPAPPAGGAIRAGETEIGIMRSNRGGYGLALLPRDLPPTPLFCGETRLVPRTDMLGA